MLQLLQILRGISVAVVQGETLICQQRPVYFLLTGMVKTVAL